MRGKRGGDFAFEGALRSRGGKRRADLATETGSKAILGFWVRGRVRAAWIQEERRSEDQFASRTSHEGAAVERV